MEILQSQPSLQRQASAGALLRGLVRIQTALSRQLDRVLPGSFRTDGNRDFLDNLVPAYTATGMRVFDVGGGKNPVISRERKRRMRLSVVGLDIDASQLALAPEGAYDDIIQADISRFSGNADADLVICQALLEHVPDVGGALKAIASILKPGGRALIFVPCRNAVYARVNLMLPQHLKRRILFSIFPEMSRDHGFRAYYDRCTPEALERTARQHGLVTESRHPYYQSDYFRFCLPLHALWRIWLVLFRLFRGAEAAETVSFVFRKDE